MAVIINELEVVFPGAPERPSREEDPADGRARALSPLEVAEIIRRRAERLARLEAH